MRVPQLDPRMSPPRKASRPSNLSTKANLENGQVLCGSHVASVRPARVCEMRSRAVRLSKQRAQKAALFISLLHDGYVAQVNRHRIP